MADALAWFLVSIMVGLMVGDMVGGIWSHYLKHHGHRR